MEFAECRLHDEKAYNVHELMWMKKSHQCHFFWLVSRHSSSHTVTRSHQICDTVRILTQVVFGHKTVTTASLEPVLQCEPRAKILCFSHNSYLLSGTSKRSHSENSA